MRRNLLLTTLLFLSLLLLSGCADKRLYRRASFYMGTTAEFNVPTDMMSASELGIEKVYDIAEQEVSRLDDMLSIFNFSSEVSKINSDNKKGAVAVSPELFRLIKRAEEYFTLTEGAFDITVGPLTEVWGFGPEREIPPDVKKVAEAMQHVGFDKISLDDKNQALHFKDPGVMLDFGGVAKGYAVDSVVQIFKRHNIKNALINIGGELYCLGSRMDGRVWTIGVKDPKNKDKVLTILNIRDKAIATSGNYENFYISSDKRYGHIIDPRSGFTVANSLASVTILADDCTTADALATAIFVLGESEGLGLIEKLSGIECLLVTSDSRILMSSGMEKYIKR